MKLNKVSLLMLSFLVLPASTNYKMEGFSFGNGGGGNIGSSNYSVEGNVGEINNGNQMIGNSYDLGAGLMFVQQANVPKAASFTNPGSYSDKLHLIIDNQNNPSDTIYAIAISPDNFVTNYFVQSDHTIGTTLTSANYQTYDLWGNSGGIDIIGLQSNTTYSVKIKAMQGKFTETGYGPVATAATVAAGLTFEIDVAPTDIQTTPPYIINMGDLNPGSLVTSASHVWVSLTTNASNGGSVFVYGQNGGLYSTTAGYTISTVNGDLGSLSSGFGAQGVGATQVGGGPFTIDVGYTGSGGVVGLTDTLVRQIFLTAGPLTGGRASFVLKAKSDNNTPEASDYSETLTVIAAANY
jgi:hypothetical protein